MANCVLIESIQTGKVGTRRCAVASLSPNREGGDEGMRCRVHEEGADGLNEAHDALPATPVSECEQCCLATKFLHGHTRRRRHACGHISGLPMHTVLPCPQSSPCPQSRAPQALPCGAALRTSQHTQARRRRFRTRLPADTLSLRHSIKPRARLPGLGFRG